MNKRKRYFWGKLQHHCNYGWIDEHDFSRYLTDEEVDDMFNNTINGQHLTTGKYENRNDIREVII